MQNFTNIFQTLSSNFRHDDEAFDYKMTHIQPEAQTRTIYITDLPKGITYLEVSEYFEKKIGSCDIKINR